jgi:hypothetical protein
VQAEQPEPLWREVVGDTEPWRRGRIFLVVLAVWVLATQIIGIGSSVLLGQIERVLAAAIGGIVFWLLFYFIWIGVHWVRWICGGSMALLAFAHLIWGIRDGNLIRLINGSLNLPISAYLALAPSVYFFALRQKERVRWKESLAVAAVFALLFVSAATTITALLGYKAQLQERGQVFADRAFRRIFIDGDSSFLRSHTTERLMKEEGWERLSWFMADRYMRIGEARNIRPARGQLQFWYQFPATLVPHGRMSTYAESDQGPVQLTVVLGGGGGDWRIDGIWWRYIDPAVLPPD